MRLYYQIMLNAIQSSTAYRMSTFMSTLHRLVFLLIQVALWTALYRNSTELHFSNLQASLGEMIVYAVFSASISLAVANDNIYRLSDQIQTGQIVTNLLRPVGLFRSLLFETVGTKLLKVIFEIVPLLLVSYLLFGISLPAANDSLWFLAAFVNGFLVFFLLTFLVGVCSFWYFRTFHLDFMLGHVINFLSGVMIPLWLFPRKLYEWTTWLPFDLIYYRPLSILLGKADASDCAWILGKGLLWLAILAIAVLCVWRIGKNKLVIQGG